VSDEDAGVIPESTGAEGEVPVVVGTGAGSAEVDVVSCVEESVEVVSTGTVVAWPESLDDVVGVLVSAEVVEVVVVLVVEL
jgi:hypothetical protein